MRQEAIFFNGRVEHVTFPCVIHNKDILVKPLFIFIGDLERDIVHGKIPLVRPLIMGSTGVARVIESRESGSEYTGRVVTISPFGKNGLLGLETDGILASYASIDRSYIDDFLAEPKPFDCIRPLIKHSYELTKKVSDPVLIEGCGLIALIAGLLLREKGIEPVYYCEAGSRRVSSLGFIVEKHMSELNKKWGTIIITSTNAAVKQKILSKLDYTKLVISRLSLTSSLPIKASTGVYEVVVVDKGEYVDNAILSKVDGLLSKLLKVLEVEKIEDSIGLIPARGLGLILSIKT